jgi:hypothetical protein
MRPLRIVSALIIALWVAGSGASALAQDEESSPEPTGSSSTVQKGVFGLGIIVGEPTGLSGKYYLGDDTAFDFAVGGAFIQRGLQAHADYLWHPWMLEQKEAFVLPAYIGLGARFIIVNARGSDEDHFRMGLRAVIGVLFDFTNVPLDVFVEAAPVVDYRTKLESKFGFGLNAGAGARYYF